MAKEEEEGVEAEVVEAEEVAEEDGLGPRDPLRGPDHPAHHHHQGLQVKEYQEHHGGEKEVELVTTNHTTLYHTGKDQELIIQHTTG